MTLEFIDKNTYIHRPNYQTKETNSSKIKLNDVRTLTNNQENVYMFSSVAPIMNQPEDFHLFIDFVKQTPEIIAPIDALVKDEISGYEFEPIGDGDNKNLIKHAYEFAEANQLLQILRKMDNDKYIYGNGYLVIGQVTDMQIKSVINTDGYEYKDYDYKELREFVDELSYKNAKIQYLPASTVSIFVNDKFGEDVVYKQTVGTDSINFKKEEVLHFKDLDYDGKLFGHSRLMSVKSEIQTIWNIKDYLGRYFDNNGTPDLLFIAPKMVPGSPQHVDFKTQLKEIKKSENKRRNLLSTSELKVEKLNDINNTMPFGDLLDKYTSIISMTYNVPPTRIGISPQGAGEALTLTNQGYYRSVSSAQDYIDNLLNTQFFIPLLKVKIKLKRDYKEDEQREVTIQKSRLDILEQMLRNKLIKREDAGNLAIEFLGKKGITTPTDEEVEEENEQNLESQVQYMQGQKSKTDLLDESKKKANENKVPKKYK
jgi:hypothetical protein